MKVRSEETKRKDAIRKKEWALKNADRLREKRRAYYEANKVKIISRSAEWVKKNRERFERNQVEYRNKNADRRRANTRNWCAKNPEKKKKMDSEYRAANMDAEKVRSRAWRVKNRARKNFLEANRKARRMKATPKWANRFFISEIYDLAQRRTKCKSGGVSWHVDHIVPLKSKLVCGLHVEHNLRVIPGAENASKGNRHWPDMP